MKTHAELADQLDCIASEVVLKYAFWLALRDASNRLRADVAALNKAKDYFEVNGIAPETPVFAKLRETIR